MSEFYINFYHHNLRKGGDIEIIDRIMISPPLELQEHNYVRQYQSCQWGGRGQVDVKDVLGPDRGGDGEPFF